MDTMQETEKELVQTLYDLISQVAALQCFLHGHEETELFCTMPNELGSYYLRMVTDYIAQNSNDVLYLSRKLVRALNEKESA